MIVVAFICFAILVLGWLMAPNGEIRADVPAQAPAPKPSLPVGEGVPA